MVPNTKIFVGSLPPSVRPEDLRRLFENYGVVTECDIMNRCGFVHMETAEMAENAIRSLNNSVFKGITISVEAGRMKERGQKGRTSGVGGGRGGNSGFGRGGMRGGRDNFMRNGPRNNGGGGPTRRDNRGGRSGPYNRNSGMSNGGGYNQRNGGGSGQFGGNKGGYGQDRYDNNSSNDIGGIGNRRFNNNAGGGNFGNQDRRGFVLPERQNTFSSDNFSGRASSGPGFNRGSFGGNQFGSGSDLFNRREQLGGQRGGSGGSGASNAFNQDFPPLSGMAGGVGMRNGPPQRNMMQNQRF